MQSFSGVDIATYTFIYTQVVFYLSVKITHTYLHTAIHILELACTHTRTSRGALLFSISRSASTTFTDK